MSLKHGPEYRQVTASKCLKIILFKLATFDLDLQTHPTHRQRQCMCRILGSDLTPQKPPSASKLLQNLMVWKFFKIDFEVTSEVFGDFWYMVKFFIGWNFVHHN